MYVLAFPAIRRQRHLTPHAAAAVVAVADQSVVGGILRLTLLLLLLASIAAERMKKRSLCANGTLTSLDLAANELDEYAGQELAHALVKNKTLAEMDLTGNCIPDEWLRENHKVPSDPRSSPAPR